MKFIHNFSGEILTWVMNNKYILLTLNLLLPVAVYFEAGPVSAFITYFGFYLVISIAMAIARETREKEEMMNEIAPHLADLFKEEEEKEKEKENHTTH